MNIRHLWQKRKSIIVTWLVSYSTVLFIPIIVSLIIYRQSGDTLTSEIHRANDYLLKQVRYTVDNQIDLMKRLNMEITWNSKLQTLMYSSSYSNDAQYTAYQLAKEMQLYQTSYASVDEFYVTWSKEEAVVRPGNIRDMKTAFQTIHEGGALSYEGWKELLRYTPGNRFFLLPRTDSSSTRNSVAYLTHLAKDLSGREAGTVVVMADAGRFQQAIEGISGFSGGQVLVLDQDNRVLLSNVPLSAGEDEILKLLKDKEEPAEPTRHGDLELMFIKSAVSDLKYALIIPSNLYWKKAEYVRRFTYISISISAIGGVLLTWFFMRRNYSPIQAMVRSLTEKGTAGGEREGNELHFIQQAIWRTRNEKERLTVEMQAHHHILRSNMLTRLLKGRPDLLVPYEEAFKTFQIRLISDEFAVMLFVVENSESLSAKLPGVNEMERRRLIQFIITNVVEELVGQHGHAGYMSEVDDMMVCLVSLDNQSSADWKVGLRQIAVEAQQFLLRFQMDLTVSIGGAHASLSGIAEAYQEALDAMEYRMVLGKQEIIMYGDIRREPGSPPESGYSYPLAAEQQLIHTIKLGQAQQAAALMNETLDLNLHRPHVSVTLARCLIFDLAGTMVKAIHEIGDKDGGMLADNPQWMETLMACDTITEMRRELLALLEEVCRYAAAKKEAHQTRERQEMLRVLVDNVSAHIRSCYADPNLNVNAIGESFGLKGSYLSKLFKEQTGEGLLDFIHSVRTSTAKAIIAGGQDAVADIARQVGYLDAASFIRVFKKYEGITPGKYRELNGRGLV
ncbi:MAG: AraC family transcriptional regulator [Paenibacillaceae bacterium]|jgi:AraC-like DNA-binding protein|nr:AraC family transcriptional regulator [Paenibacillaceae bacterium]